MSKNNWKSVKLYYSGDDYYRDALEAIAQAQLEVLIESYIFNLDGIGLRFVKACEEAQQRGVSVRILVDGIGTYNWLPQLVKSCSEKHIPLRVFHPLPVRLDSYWRISWKSLRRLLTLFQKINKRDHRKIIAIDAKHCFLGSFNISQVHTYEYMEEDAWRDTGVVVEGPEVSKIREAFYEAWKKSKYQSVSHHHFFLKKKRKPYNAGDSLLRLNSKIHWRYMLLKDFKRRLKTCTQKVFITNAYFLPRQAVLRYLRKAAKRGVDVRLCLPAKTDVAPVQWASRSLYYRLIKDGVRIFEYQPRILHAKTMIIDDWATVGSHNLNHRSLNHDLEIEAVLAAEPELHSLEKQFELDLSLSKEILMSDLKQHSLLNRILGRVAYWFKYWL